MFSDVFVLLLSRSLERTLGMRLGLEDLFIEYVVHLRSTDLEKKTGSSNLLFSLPENCHLVGTTFEVNLTIRHG